MTPREELHRLVDHIPESQVATTQKLLRALVDPVELAILSAEEDDEPESEDERAAVEAQWQTLRPTFRLPETVSMPK